VAKEGLKIKKGGTLWRTRWVYDEAKGEGSYVEKDVTERAVTLLFEHCELDAGVTLRDIFLLLKTELGIFDAIIGNWCEEIVNEGLTREKTPDRNSDIEYLELYWHIYKDKDYDTKKSTFGGYIFPQFHGVGFLQEKDKFDEYGNLECKAGDRTPYGISFTPASDLIDLPIKLDAEVRIYNEDDWKETPQTFELGEYSLGHILYGVIWELSFHGGPDQRDETAKDLFNSVDEMRKELNNESD